MMCYGERYTLMYQCVIVFIICVMRIGGAFISIYVPLVVNTMSFLTKTNLNFMQNISCWAPSQNEKMVAALQQETYIAA